jgi:hypothetical protein
VYEYKVDRGAGFAARWGVGWMSGYFRRRQIRLGFGVVSPKRE